MISYVTVGAETSQAQGGFTPPSCQPLATSWWKAREGLSYELPELPGEPAVSPAFYVKRPFDGQPATAGNGVMVAFQAQSQQEVRELHSAALAANGRDEGQPGFRDAYGPHFYVAYLRDPQGNKIALYSNNPAEPGRHG